MKRINGGDLMAAERNARDNGYKVRHPKEVETIIYNDNGGCTVYKKEDLGYSVREYKKTPNKYLIYKY